MTPGGSEDEARTRESGVGAGGERIATGLEIEVGEVMAMAPRA